MVIVSLHAYIRKGTSEGEPSEWINLRELWLKAGYKIPYHRWVKYTLKNFELQPMRKAVKSGKPGKPKIHYFIPTEHASELLGAVERRRHCEVRIIR